MPRITILDALQITVLFAVTIVVFYILWLVL